MSRSNLFNSAGGAPRANWQAHVGARLGSWRLDFPLGRGAGGTVWACTHVDRGTTGALKLLVHPSPLARERMRREARVLGMLDDPALPRLIDTIDDPDLIGVVMERVNGAALDTVARGGGLTDGQVAAIAADLCGALAVAHEGGVAHRDLKPEHVLVDGTGRVHVIDFGISRATDDPRLTRTVDGPPGTPPYAAPEWWRREPFDAFAADAWSLGACLFLLCTGRPPAPGDTSLDPGQRRPEQLRDVVRSLTRHDPTRRMRPAEAAIRVRPLAGARQVDARTPNYDEPNRCEGGGPTPQLTTFTSDIVPVDAATGEVASLGRYRILRELGRGGMGVVLEALDPELGRVVALKLLPAGRFADPEAARRFLHEARAVARLRHPDIVPVLDIGRSSDGPFFTMEMVNGPTLAATLAERGPLAWELAAAWVARIARALHHAHERGVVHRDIKPSNILLEGGTEPRVVDFGLAFDTGTDQAITRDGRLMGTPAYMSPEQAGGRRDRIGPSTDVYAVGVLLYEMLTGEPAYGGETPTGVLRRVANGLPPTDPRTLRPDLPSSLVRVCAKAMQLEPSDRYLSAAALADDLDVVLRGGAVRGPTFGAWLPDRRARRGLALVVSFGLVVVVFLVSSSMWGVWSDTSRERAAQARWSVVRERIEELWREGHQAEAADTVRAFAGAQVHRGTDAASQAWATLAQRQAQEGQTAAARTAWVRAWLDAPDADRQADALVGLARTNWQNWDLPGWGAALEALRAVRPERLGEPEVASLVADLALARRETTAAHLSDPLIRELSRARAVNGPFEEAFRWDPDGDGRAEWFGLRREPLRLVALDGNRPDIQLPDAPATLRWPRVASVRGGPGWLFAVDGAGQPCAWRWAAGRPVRIYSALPGIVRGATAVDLYQDGSEEVYLATGQRLVRLDADGTLTDVEPDTTAARSEMSGIDHADIDGDGREELLVAAGEWQAYDIRALTVRDGAVTLLGRLKLGSVGPLRAWRGPEGVGIVVEKQDRYASREVFPLDAPTGRPAGHWLAAWDPAGRLSATQLLPADEAVPFGEPLLADLDGDGIDEIVTQRGADVVVLRLEGAAWHTRLLTGIKVIETGEADGDADDEMLVRLDAADGSRSWWMLGTGSAALPPMPARSGGEEQGDPPKDPAIGGMWQRAQLLARMGLLVEAAEAYQELAAVAADPADRVAACDHAAHLLGAASRPDDAARAWLMAAQLAAEPGDRLVLAARAWHGAGRPVEEHHAWTLQQSNGPLPEDGIGRLAVLSVLDEDAPGWVETFDHLDPSWHARACVGARLDTPAGSLRIDALPSELLARPVDWDGGALFVEADLTIDAMDWSGALRVGLHDSVTDRWWGVGLQGHGGGGVVHPYTADWTAQPATRLDGRVPVGRPLRLRMMWLPSEGNIYLTALSDGLPLWHTVIGDAGPPPPGIDPWLTIATDGQGPARTAVHLQRLEVRGITPREGRPAYREGLSWRALVEGHPEDVADPLGQAVLLAARGRVDEAWGRMQASPLRDALLAHYLRIEPAGWMGPMADRLGDDLSGHLVDAWRVVIEDAGDSVAPRTLGLDLLAGFELRPLPASRDARLAVATLLRVRADAAVQAGLAELAHSVLVRLATLVALEPAAASETTDDLLSARVAMMRGDAPGAMGSLQHALGRAPARTVVADRILADPILVGLHTQPAWGEITRAAMGPFVEP